MPGCGAPMESDAHGFACPQCSLAGDETCIGALTFNLNESRSQMSLATRAVLDEAERLLRAAGVFMGEEGGVSLRHYLRGERVNARTLFEAYEACRKLQESRNG